MLFLTLYLGRWQQERAAEKAALQIEFETRALAKPVMLGAPIPDPIALRYFPASARGEWQVSGQIFLDNKFDKEAVGFHVITPLKIEETNTYVLVNRGWVARGTSYPKPPSISAPSGSVLVEGALSLPSSRFLELAEDTVQGSVWQNLTVERYHRATGHQVLPLVLLVKNADAPFKAVTEHADARAEKHVEYMLTWYSLAATVAILWLTLNIKYRCISVNAPPISERKVT
jgi:surfeit locus 1 family protein